MTIFDGAFYFEALCGMEHTKRSGAERFESLFGTDDMSFIVYAHANNFFFSFYERDEVLRHAALTIAQLIR